MLVIKKDKAVSDKVLYENLMHKNFGFKTQIYLMLMFSVFPLFIINYTNLTRTKYILFLVFTLLFFASILYTFCGLILDGYKPKISFKFNQNKAEFFLLCFLLFSVVSYLLSPYKNIENPNGMSSFIFGYGRYDGFLTLSLYVFVFLLISKFGSFKKTHLYLVTISVCVMSLITVIQSFGFNPFWLFPDGGDGGIHMFASTIGNIDLLSTVFCITLPLISLSYLFLNVSRLLSALILFAVFINTYSVFLIGVNSGNVAYLTLFAIILPVLLKKGFLLYKSLFLMSSIIFACSGRALINLEYIQEAHKTNISLSFSLLFWSSLIIGFILFVFGFILFKKNREKILKVNRWYIVVIAELIVLSIVLIYIYNYSFTDSDSGVAKSLLSEISDLLHGKITMSSGTGRIGIWFESFKIALKSPLFGTGLGSYAKVFLECSESNYSSTSLILDNPHNEYLSIFFTNGLIGLILYFGFLISVAFKSFKTLLKNEFTLIFFSVTLCYLIQAFFNFSIVICAPLFWISIALLQRSKDFNEYF